MRAFISIRWIVVLLFTLPASAIATDYPLTVVDDLGRSVTLKAEPTRIVTMIPSHTEVVCALGACERLVGVDMFSDYPTEVAGLPKLGSGFSPDLEALVALEPDLVLVDESSGIAAALDDLGLTVYAGTAQTLEEVFDDLTVIGELLDRQEEAARLSQRLRSEIDAVAQRVAGRRAPSVYLELDATPYSVGPGSFIGNLVILAGGVNIVTEGMGDFPQLDPEFIVAANPEIIVLADAPYGERAALVAGRPGWEGLRAVVDGAVFELSQEQVDALSRPGPRIAAAVTMLARLFHPDLF